MPPQLPSYLIKALSNLSPNIQIFPTLHADRLADTELSYANDTVMSQSSFAYEKDVLASMENWQFFEFYESNYSVLLSDNKPNEVASFRYW